MNVCVSKLLVWLKKWSKMGCPRSATRSLIAVAKYFNVQFVTKYAVLDQIKLRMLELSVRRSQGNFCTVYICC